MAEPTGIDALAAGFRAELGPPVEERIALNLDPQEMSVRQLLQSVQILRAELTDLQGQNALTESHFANYVAEAIVEQNALRKRAEAAEADARAAEAERDSLRAELVEQDDALGELGAEIDERERLEALLDRFAAAVAPVEVIGEHSSGNDPWANALDMVTPASEVDRLRQAIELLGRSAQAESQDIIDVCSEVIALRRDTAEFEQVVAELTAKNLDLIGERGRLRAALARAEAVMNKALSEVEHEEVVYLLHTYLATRQAVGE